MKLWAIYLINSLGNGWREIRIPVVKRPQVFFILQGGNQMWKLIIKFAVENISRKTQIFLSRSPWGSKRFSDMSRYQSWAWLIRNFSLVIAVIKRTREKLVERQLMICCSNWFSLLSCNIRLDAVVQMGQTIILLSVNRCQSNAVIQSRDMPSAMDVLMKWHGFWKTNLFGLLQWRCLWHLLT